MFARSLLVAGLAVPMMFVLLPQAAPETPTPRPRYKNPLGLAIDPAGRYAYVALHTADALAVVDLQDDKVLCEIPVGRWPYDVALADGIAYVTCEADDTLVAVDVAARKVKRVYKVGQTPRGVAVDPVLGLIQVVCHDDKTLWTMTSWGLAIQTPIPPQPEGNFARPRNLQLVLGKEAKHRRITQPFGLFTRGRSVVDPNSVFTGLLDFQRTAFNPLIDLDYSRSSMDLVAHTRPRWFTPTVRAPQGRVFTNALSFFTSSTKPAEFVLLDEPTKGYPDPTDVIVTLPKSKPQKRAPLPKVAKADTHPLKGSKVFISSGGADAVVVVDMTRAIKHVEKHPSNQILGGMMGMMGGSMIGGGWGMSMSGMGMGTMSGMGMSGGWGVSGFPPGTMNGGMSGMNMMGGPMLAMPTGMHNPNLHRPAPPAPAKPNPALPIAAFALTPAATPTAHGCNMTGGGMMGGGMIGMMGGGWMNGIGVPTENLAASTSYVIARIPTQANPRRMVLSPDGKILVVANHLADSLTLIDTQKLKVLRHISLNGPAPDLARRGEITFHSAKFTRQQQFTCASCHPNHGSDGLAWDTSPKGNGEPLNTRALHGVRDTAPFGWKGESETLEERAKNTMREVHKHQLSDADASAIAAFVRTLDPPRPLPHKPKDEPAIARGKAIFYGKGNCRSCHRGEAFMTDSPRAIILDTKQKLTAFDVPSLRGVGRSAPYLHDGRASTLQEIFEFHNPQKRHGNAHELTPQERCDLVTFLKTL